jgi:hypothetical protein
MKTPGGMGPPGVTKEQTMLDHRKLLPRIVVILTVKVKIIIRSR